MARVTTERLRRHLTIADHKEDDVGIHPVTLLIIDDDKMIRRVLSDYAWLTGWSSITANDGAAGYLAAQNQRFDIILTDYQMPRMNGIAMTERIRGGSGPNCETPILVMTGINCADVRREASAAGATAVMIKPVLLEEFREIVSGKTGVAQSWVDDASAARA